MTQPRWMKHCIVAACIAFGMATASADTVTLTFDSFDEPLYPLSYTQSGFIITSLEPNGGHLHAGDGFLLLHSRQGSSPYHIQRIGGGTFDFLSFDYAGGDSLFVGSNGATFTILGDQPLANFTLSAAFQNVTYIDWYMNNPGDLSTPDPQWGQIDNVVLNIAAVPEPAQAAMLGLGLAGLMLHGRRARRRRSSERQCAATAGPIA